MRRLAFILVLLPFLGAPALAQDGVSLAPTDPVASTDTLGIEMPELIGGLGTIIGALEYPTSALAAGAEGRVVVTFVVTERGTVEEAEVTSHVHPALDHEALAAVQRARFVPAHRSGRPLRVRMALPVTFDLPAASG